MTTTNTVFIEPALSKNEILERLLKAEHITFQEMITLMDRDVVQIPSLGYPICPQWPVTYTNNS